VPRRASQAARVSMTLLSLQPHPTKFTEKARVIKALEAGGGPVWRLAFNHLLDVTSPNARSVMHFSRSLRFKHSRERLRCLTGGVGLCASWRG